MDSNVLSRIKLCHICNTRTNRFKRVIGDIIRHALRPSLRLTELVMFVTHMLTRLIASSSIRRVTAALEWPETHRGLYIDDKEACTQHSQKVGENS